MRNKNIKAKLWLAIGILFVAYYLFEGIVVGFGFSLLWLWFAAGVACIILSALTFKYGRIPIPKWLFFVFCILLSVIIAVFCAFEVLIVSHMSEVGEKGLDYIVVLGAKVRNDEVPTKPLYHRIGAAEKYLRENPNTIAVLSGGKGADEPISEAMCMYNVLTSRGIPKERLIIEDKSTSTNENIRFSLSLMRENSTFGVVTNNFHVYRAMQISKKISGRDVSGIAAPYGDTLLIHYMAREAVGILKDYIGGNMDF